MFTLGVSPREIQDTLFQLKDVIYPRSIKLAELTRIIFGTSTDIQRRKVRLAIKILRKQGHLIIANNGYSMAGDDPEPVIHFINGMCSRAHSLTTDADIMYRGLKQKYGDSVAEKVEMIPGQPGLNMHTYDLRPDVKIKNLAINMSTGVVNLGSKDGTLHNV